MFERSNESAVINTVLNIYREIRNWDISFEQMNGYILNERYNLETEIAQ